MLRSLAIKNFRALRELRLSGLGRVNLLVGSNNSGKTSVLEAVQFLAAGGDIRALTASLARRGEKISAARQGSSRRVLDLRFLFHGRTLDGPPIQVEAETSDGRRLQFAASTARVPIDDAKQLELWREALARPARFAPEEPPDEGLGSPERVPRILEVKSEGSVIGRASLDLGGGLDSEDAIIRRSGAATSVQFISTASLTQESLARLYDRVVLANEEDLVVRALNAVEENTITKIAAVERSESGGYGSSRGIVVGLRGSVEPVPLGNLGDGMTRMLAIALSLVAARNGYLLVDEIDTGLHYTVMRKMWKLVFETATRLNVCVYATTHSYDCVHALAAIARPGVQQDGEVSLIRVDRERPDAVHFSEREITLLAEREIEAR